MQYDFSAIPDAEIPPAVEPVFQHVVLIGLRAKPERTTTTTARAKGRMGF